jgi:type I restriction-modification system DNA methylase subunit
MSTHTCPTCLDDFDQKGKLTRHLNKKNKCKPSSTVTALLQANPIQVTIAGPFRETSLKMNTAIDLETRQEQGIFFTPKKARSLAFEKLKELGLTNPKIILEPSCGTGEFIDDALIEYPNSSIVGIEMNTQLFKTLKPNDKVTLLNEDFTLYKGGQVDLVIGNPPFSLKNVGKNINCMNGRPNLYVLFLYKCLTEHLNVNGFLAFILPTSFFNCSYYEETRNYIYHHCSIKFLEELDVTYHETSQDTMLIVIQNCVDAEHNYFFERNGSKFISPFFRELRELVKNTSTLGQLGFTVKTGEVVWNQVKGQLRDTEDDGATVVIYSTNIKNGTLVFNNIVDKKGEKKQYVKKSERIEESEEDKKARRARKEKLPDIITCDPVEGPAIVVNRGYGNSYTLNFAHVTLKEFYAENHVNMILPSNEAAKEKIQDVLKSLGSNRTKKFIDWFVGKGAMSKTEVEKVLPIFS